jgi:hypothetical protein
MKKKPQTLVEKPVFPPLLLGVEKEFKKAIKAKSKQRPERSDADKIAARCLYEYFCESAAMRATRVLPTCQDLIARSALTFALDKAGWRQAGEKNQAPPPWDTL